MRCLSQLDHCTLLAIVDVDIRLCGRYVPVTNQCHQHKNADTFTCQIRDERPATAMTRSTLDADCAVQMSEVLRQCVRVKSFLHALLRVEKFLLLVDGTVQRYVRVR